jgi:hypothetical protein
MQLREGLERAPAWEHRLYQAMTTDGTAELARAIAWYEELAARSLDPSVDFQLAVLYGEAGERLRVQKMAEEWETRPGLLVSLAPLIRTAYVAAPESPAVLAEQAEQLAQLPEGWFAHRVVIAWATRVGDEARLVSARAAAAAQSDRLLRRIRGLAAIEVTVITAGSVVLIAWYASRRRRLCTVGDAIVPPPWNGRLGGVVLVRGGAAGVLVLSALIVLSGLIEPWIDLESPLLEPITWPLMYLPLLLLARRYLLGPAGLEFRRALGVWPVRGGWRRLGMAATSLLAVSAIGEWMLALASASISVTSHWSEWFDRDLVWGDGLTLTSSLVSTVVIAPVFEEIAFRGVLFATLRCRFGVMTSALGSAAIFAVAHGYGAVGFADVFWSGFLWAWAFEKTGSVLPGIAAHGGTNLIVSLTIMGLLR